MTKPRTAQDVLNNVSDKSILARLDFKKHRNVTKMSGEIGNVQEEAQKALYSDILGLGSNFLKSIGEDDKIEAWKKYVEKSGYLS